MPEIDTVVTVHRCKSCRVRRRNRAVTGVCLLIQSSGNQQTQLPLYSVCGTAQSHCSHHGLASPYTLFNANFRQDDSGTARYISMNQGESVAVWKLSVTDAISTVFQATDEFSRPSILYNCLPDIRGRVTQTLSGNIHFNHRSWPCWTSSSLMSGLL